MTVLEEDEEENEEEGTEGWESAAGVSFTVQKGHRDAHGEVKRGTKFIFDLKDEQSEFLEA